jgi:glycosyltransferase involved in cell wall biosynthesis
MAEPPYRVLAVASHPVQYMAPILRKMAQHAQMDLHVAYCSLRGAQAGIDPEFGATVQWDVPLLEGYSWTHVSNCGSGKEGFFGLCNPGLWGLIRSGRYDAVLCYLGYVRASFWIAYCAAKVSGSAFLFGTDTTTLDPLDGRMWKRRVKRILWPRLFRLATQVIVPSSGSRDLMLSLGIPAERVTLTPYVVDNDWWIAQAARANRKAVRVGWNAAPDDLVILFCAKLQPWKQPMDLLRAFARAGLPKAILVFAGEGPLRSQLESEASALGVRDRVRFLGFANQSELPAIYAASDLLVLPSSYDAFGVVVNEAMLCGCPVAASDKVGAGRDLIAPIAPDFIYSCGDVDALAVVLRRAHDDRTRLVRIAAAGKQRMASWSPLENIESHIEALEHGLARLDREV